MSKQMLFCVETSSNAKTDTVYIDETLNQYYRIGNDIRKRYIYLNGKSNYNRKKVIQDIEKQTNQYASIGTTTVVYCLDTDRYDSDSVQFNELNDVMRFCETRGFEFVWFCRDIEDVFWGESVANADKKDKASEFRSSGRIKTLSESKLRKRKFARHHSNILQVLDKHLKRVSE